MNEDEKLQKLLAIARMETPPRIDVTERVMAAVRDQALQRAEHFHGLGWVAGFSAAAAVPAVVAGFAAWRALTDPLMGVFIEWKLMTP